MAEAKLKSSKQLKLDKTNSTILLILAVCSFIFVFSLVASKALISQYSYQNRVTNARQATVDQLSTDKTNAATLLKSYNTFVNTSTNIIGGSTSGSGNQDGTNSKIILDALPTKNDFPALATSIQNILTGQGVSITGITGTDTGSAATAGTAVAAPATTTPTVPTTGAAATVAITPIAIPFSFTVQGNFASMQNVLASVEKSIRPIQILSIDLTGSDTNLTMSVAAQTYYLPSSGLNVTSETIK